ncbi:MAG: PASTA domain-containing protein, partial [Actinomycetota bacterium]|nr:PASTA domain-containing protein [Actinomycetota bacterium]
PGDSGLIRMEEGGDEPGSGRRTALIWTAVVLALLLVIAGTAYALLRPADKKTTTPPVETTQVPNLVGLTQAAATSKIKENKLTLAAPVETVRSCPIPTVQKNQVCTQSPDPGGVVDINTPVSISIFIGPEQVPVPLLIRLKYADAIAQITRAGLVVSGTPKAVDNKAPTGTVLSQNPLPGTPIDKGGKVSFEYSTGQLKILDVTGRSFTDGSQLLNQQGFANVDQTPQTVPNTDFKRNGKIVRTNPAKGSTVEVTTKITIYVYADAPPPVTCTTPPTPPTAPTSPTKTPPTKTPPTTPPVPPTSPPAPATPAALPTCPS